MIKKLRERIKAAYHCLIGNSVIINAGIEVTEGKARIYVMRPDLKDGDKLDGYMYVNNFHKINGTICINCPDDGFVNANYIEYGARNDQ